MTPGEWIQRLRRDRAEKFQEVHARSLHIREKHGFQFVLTLWGHWVLLAFFGLLVVVRPRPLELVIGAFLLTMIARNIRAVTKANRDYRARSSA